MNLLRALATVSGLTLLSRILGLAREILVANLFGAGLLTDAFNVAFRLPNLLRRLFAEGAFSQAFVPILAEYRNQRGEAETRTLISHVTTLLGLAVLIVSLLGMVGAPWIIHLTAGGFSQQPEKFALTVELTRITFPYIFFMSMVALSAGVLNTWSRFSVPAFTPVLLNISFIGMMLLAAPYFAEPVKALAWGAFIGGVLQLLLQIPALAKIGMLPRFSLSFRDPGVRRILLLMGPATLGVSVAQVSLLINTAFASWLPTGSVSWLNYADRLMEFPMGILGAALGTILLPSLSKLRAANDAEGFSATLDWGLRVALLLTAPAAVGMMLLAVPLAATLFQHGAFTATDTLQTRQALITYSMGLLGLILVKILAPAFYSRQDIRTPLKYALISLLITQLLNLLFIFVLDLRHAGLALSISVAATLNAALLFRGLRRRAAYLPAPGWRLFALKLLTALVALGLVLWLTAGADARWLERSSLWRLTNLAWVMGAGMATYFATLFALGFRVKDFRRRVH
ncbi:MAG: murein biosynthesis integral membrane protein MurJ [Candidatus Dactylopiibacterium carminicum]|uniref:Probable lipid II flippase MurJ n=1 Tax=Candidatus Dactylopiibacterium carminicum TaxID=857335 RepID=A0A272ER19_9RHOO|nr:murein biosynthesis integral membrane protein MurJ [Candidatus Dactylopiibacterium carminicum]KAF7598667.1 murein biosynthesis integral membrane protein MurJ [Candidatus Dactylopiibacterium carminicum]PAS92557.1 MAG: murein biosynthesis integral membrane protein MurJ [Candidatus Dactylopiibacterium carminicum]PAS96084.1 MAG: murein biosynthesis integral membrane protein MurJ [Candidatus Dactylopiibacterium carminicum]PAS98535.1 MAG: murein biosynthesis integral membrane protein MurJ [Candida